MKVVFLHLPKTAGTSLAAHLQAQYPQSEVKLAYGGYQLQASDLENYSCILGHLPWENIGEAKANERARDFKWISFLRNPVDRAISHYLAIKYGSQSDHAVLFAQWGDFEGFLQSDQAHNWQCRFFSGDKRGLWRGREEALLEVASGHLQQLDFVGIVEEYQESLTQLQRHLGQSAHASQRMLNTSPQNEEALRLKEQYGAQLEKQHQTDFALYQWALNRLKSTGLK